MYWFWKIFPGHDTICEVDIIPFTNYKYTIKSFLTEME